MAGFLFIASLLFRRAGALQRPCHSDIHSLDSLELTHVLLSLLLKGLWDQALALTWLRDHIATFGGDPNNVTVIGEGSGAVCAGYHVVSPRSTGLFSKVVMMSGSPVCPASRDCS